MSEYFGTLSRLLVHPTSPVLLTKNGPLGTLAFIALVQLSNLVLGCPGMVAHRYHSTGVVPIQSLRVGQSCYNPDAAYHYLYRIQLLPSSSYPEGNFGGNQLLDGSISLSPLYPDQTNDLHVSCATSLHQSFPWLHSVQA